MSSVHLSLTVRADDLKVAYSAAFRLLEYLEDREPPTGRIEEESPTASGALVVGDPPGPPEPSPALLSAIALLEQLVDDDACVDDHHGSCQTHGPGDIPCPVAAARAWLASLQELPA